MHMCADVCLCPCANIRAVYTCVNVSLYAYIYLCVHFCACICMCASMCACMYLCANVYVYTCVHMFACMFLVPVHNLCVHVYPEHVFACVHMCVHVDVRVSVCACMSTLCAYMGCECAPTYLCIFLSTGPSPTPHPITQVMSPGISWEVWPHCPPSYQDYYFHHHSQHHWYCCSFPFFLPFLLRSLFSA